MVCGALIGAGMIGCGGGGNGSLADVEGGDAGIGGNGSQGNADGVGTGKSYTGGHGLAFYHLNTKTDGTITARASSNFSLIQ